jgi:hypothetical protein
MAQRVHAVVCMRRDLLILLFAALAAMTMPLALHFYNKARLLEADIASMQLRCAGLHR